MKTSSIFHIFLSAKNEECKYNDEDICSLSNDKTNFYTKIFCTNYFEILSEPRYAYLSGTNSHYPVIIRLAF